MNLSRNKVFAIWLLFVRQVSIPFNGSDVNVSDLRAGHDFGSAGYTAILALEGAKIPRSCPWSHFQESRVKSWSNDWASCGSDISTQPVVTSDDVPASIPAIGSGINTILVPGPGSSTRTLIVSANNSTTIVLSGEATDEASSTASEALTTDGQQLSSTSTAPRSTSTSTSRTSSSTSPPASTPTTSNKSPTNTGAIAGGVVGRLAVVGIVVIALYWNRRTHPKISHFGGNEGTNRLPPEYTDHSHPDMVYTQRESPDHRPQELEGRLNQINELLAKNQRISI